MLDHDLQLTGCLVQYKTSRPSEYLSFPHQKTTPRKIHLAERDRIVGKSIIDVKSHFS